MVSMPEMSSKNQPQLVYMSMAWRSSSMSNERAGALFSLSSCRVCARKKVSREARERSSTTSM